MASSPIHVVDNMNKSLAVKIAIAVIVCLVVGGLSGYATAGAIDSWYAGLSKPIFNPPNWIFGPVWTVLYILMGISAGIIWNKDFDEPEVKKALGIFGVHLLLNAAWTLIFFGLQEPLWAFIEIFVLLGSIIIYTRMFYRIIPAIGWLQTPYILWVSFATVLNGAIVWLN